LINGDALPRLGCDKDLVRGLSFFAAPRNLSHRANEAASARGWREVRQLLGDFPVEGKLPVYYPRIVGEVEILEEVGGVRHAS
jgi:hypothetical protein